MSGPDRAALLRQALVEVRELRARIDALEGLRREPVAIVGMACRFPGGADGPEDFWRLLSGGVDATCEVPPDRWDVEAFYDPDPAAPGKVISRRGGFLGRVDLFDAEFFGISPREAARMDPQQRLALEVAWEALEHAAISPAGLAGSRTGVVLGACANDYHRLHGALEAADGYDGAGNAMSILANRVSYLLDLRGPSFTIDTACSSSLVAVHLACGLLRGGEADVVLAGGVQLMLAPDTSVVFSKTQLLSPDGRCKTFDARADGMARGEGCGVVVLQRLSDALAAGHRVRALIRGSAVNQDGRSNGLTAPNVLAQQEVLRRALAAAGVPATALGYLEAHGTGTALGDPIEIEALKAVLGEPRTDGSRCAIGSVKTNVGHLEAAAGIAGLIKAALVLGHDTIPPHLHLRTLNPSITLGGTPFFVPTETTPWPGPRSPRVAGVSSFGLGGTNAHVILEEAPVRAGLPPAPERSRHLLVLSAASPGALSELTRRHAEALGCDGAPQLGDYCHTAAVGRAHLEHRSAFVAADAREMAGRLESAAAGRPGPAAIAGRSAGNRRIAFLFTGQGAQYPGMGRELYETQPAFRETLERCDRLAAPLLGRSLTGLLFEAGAGDALDETEHAQPALFAIEYALFELWRSWGIEPAALLGHSIGECAVAAAAGVLALEDALRLVCARGRLMAERAARGAMASAATSERRAAEVIARAGGGVVVAAVNGPGRVTLSGSAPALDAVVGALEREGVEVRRLRVSHAFHSPLVDPMLDAFEAEASGLAYSPPRLPVVSEVSGLPASLELATAAYWRRQVRAPVRFFAGMQTLREMGISAFLEIGPHPVLIGLGRECLPGLEGLWLPSLRRGRSDWEQMLESLGRLHVEGAAEVDWRGFDRGYVRRRVALPTYPWQRRRHWIESPRAIRPAEARPPAPGPEDDWRDWIYGLEWRPRFPLAHGDAPRAAVCAAASGELPAGLRERIRDAAGAAPSDAEIGPALDAVCGRFAAAALASLAAGAPEPLAAADWERVGVLPGRRRLFERLLAIAAEDAGRPKAAGAAPTDAAAEVAALRDRYPEWRRQLDLLTRCGAALADVLRGSTDPRGLLFPGGSTADVEAFYRDSPYARAANATVAAVAARLLEQRPEGRTARILEIGAGTGATTEAVLAALVPGSFEYLFTDISPQLVARGRAKFPGRPELRCRVLDAERPPAAQGFAPQAFDLVLAANTVHATRDVAAALAHAGALLAPGGVLVLLETVRPERWVDLIFGLLDEWWRFTDTDLRPAHPLLDARRWTRVLDSAGFENLASFPAPDSEEDPLRGQAVLVARSRAGRVADAVPRAPGRWLLVGDETETAAALARLVPEACRRVAPGREAAEALDRLGREPVDQIVVLAGSRGTDAAPEAARQTREALDLVQQIAGAALPAPPRLWLVTTGAQAATAGDLSIDPAQAALWGLGRVIGMEHPALWGGLCDLDAGAPAAENARALLGHLLESDREPQAAIRGGQRWVARLVRVRESERGAPRVRPDATYLVTGGLGGLGIEVAGWLVRRGARHLVLAGRSGPDESAAEAVAELGRTGAVVVVRQVDVSRRAEVEALLGDIRRTLPALGGVVHSAGVLADGVLQAQDWDRFARVFAPKVDGSWNLHRATAEEPLDFFVLFSSIAGLMGSPGQGNHAAANAFMDALAALRRAAGIPGLSIGWGGWGGTGAAIRLGADAARRLESLGIRLMAPEGALAGFEQGLTGGRSYLAVAALDWTAIAAAGAPVLVAEVLEQEIPGGGGAPVAAGRPGWSQAVLAAAGGERAEVLERYLTPLLERLTGATLPAGQDFVALGLDSLMVIELVQALKRDLDLVIYPREVYEHATVSALAGHLAEEIVRAHGPAEARPAPATGDPIGPLAELPKPAPHRGPRTPGPVFVLSSPRSGSTLLRVMLAGHPALFSPPELHLLPFEDLKSWHQALQGSFLEEGLQRALMELEGLDAASSRARLDDLIAANPTVGEVYELLRRAAAPRRLVDKSPTYGLDRGILLRAEDLFEGAHYIHLVRHPYAVLESFVRMRMDRVVGIKGADRHELAEETWAATNRNMLEFRRAGDPARHAAVGYEELVATPEPTLRRLCAFLGLAFDGGMLRPYDGGRMTDGVHPWSMPIDDPNFRTHKGIDGRLADVWRTIELPAPLRAETVEVARKLGYELPRERIAAPIRGEPAMRESFVEVRGLRLAVCSWGDADGPLVLCTHGGLDHGASWEGVARGLTARGYRVVAPDLRGHGRSAHAAPGSAYHVLDFVADLDALVRVLGRGPVVLVGHSFGAGVAALYAGARSRHDGVPVEAVVLAEPVTMPDFGPADLGRQLEYLAAPGEHPILPDLEAAAGRLRSRTPELARDWALRMAERLTEPCDGGLRWRSDFRIMRSQIVTFGLSPGAFPNLVAREIAAPVTLVYGAESGLMERAEQSMLREAAPVVVLPGGHNLHLQSPAALAEAIAIAHARVGR